MDVNGPVSKMYHLNPFYEPTKDMELPTCMYKLENVHKKSEDGLIHDIGKLPTDNVGSPVVEDLERRQDRILSEIEKLQHQVQELLKKQNITLPQNVTAAASLSVPTNAGRSRARPPSAPVPAPVPVKVLGTSTKAPTSNATSAQIQDLVIGASPSNPPLSLLVLQQMLSKQFNVLSSSYFHSSAKSLNSAHLKDLFGASDSIPSNRNSYQIGFTIVWKETKYGPVLKVNATQHTPIIGECNVARYLARLLSPAYDSGDAVTSTQLDAIIDLADGQLSNDATQRANFMKAISGRLGKSQWMFGDSLSLADIVLWSAVHQSKQASKAPDNVKRWIELCNQQPEFAIARQLI